MDTLAAWLFVLPLFAIGALPDVTKIQGTGIAVLAFAAVVILQRSVSRRGAAVMYVTFSVLTLLLLAHLALASWPAFTGSRSSYDRHALIFVGTYTVVAIYAGVFYREDVFRRVMWRGATLALWAGVTLCLLSRVTGHPFLANAIYGTIRMSGPLEEPSAWAAPLTVVLLMALRRRSKLYVVLSLAGLVLAELPDVHACHGGHSARVLRAGAAPPAPAGDPRGLRCRADGDGAVRPARRLSGVPRQREHCRGGSRAPGLGIRNVETGGTDGENGRFQSVQVVIATAEDHGWLRYGAGLAADGTYLPAVYPAAGGGVAQAANALWLVVLFDLGVAGLAVLAVLMAVAVWRMRRHAALAAVFLPFMVSSLVNSSGPDTLFVALAIMLFVPGYPHAPWPPPSRLPGKAGRCPRGWRQARQM